MRYSKCTISLCVTTASTVVYFEYTTTRVSSDHNSHTFCYFCFCVFETVSFLFVVGWSFLFFVAPSLAVFLSASVFNQDVSKWITGAVTDMRYSKCTISLCVTTASTVVYFEYTTTRVSSDHTSHTFCYFCFVYLKRYSFVVVCGGLVFLFFVAPSSCSVFIRICVQSGRVQMEYGGGDKYVSK